jgi:glycosyltransferase involved in cell wall biosynthesis
MTVDVVLPCLDEAAALPGVLAALPPGYRAIVVDNGSTDGSADVARAHGATVVVEGRRGFGAAVHAGLLAAGSEVVAVLDADGSLDPGDLPRLAAPVLAGEADLVLGRRRPVDRSAWPAHARLANRVLAGAIRRASGVRVHDLGPMRVLRREAVLALGLEDRRSGYPLEMVLRAAEEGLRITELEVPYRPRIGRSKVTGTVRGTLTAVADMRRILRARSTDPAQRPTAPNQ